jgi:hypothetical protein
MSAIKSGIDSLFRTSIFIRNHTSQGNLQHGWRTRSFDSRADVMYVRDRYPLVAFKHPSLAVRLGEANARRRQQFKYCRDYKNLFSEEDTTTSGSDAKASEQDQAPLDHQSHQLASWSEAGPARAIPSAATKPSIPAETEATEFIVQPFEDRELSEHPDADPAWSVVSFATTVGSTTDDGLAFPPLPSEAEQNTTFLCPYCFTVIELKGRDKTHQWRFVHITIEPPSDRHSQST